jgi:hypothetical protein
LTERPRKYSISVISIPHYLKRQPPPHPPQRPTPPQKPDPPSRIRESGIQPAGGRTSKNREVRHPAPERSRVQPPRGAAAPPACRSSYVRESAIPETQKYDNA